MLNPCPARAKETLRKNLHHGEPGAASGRSHNLRAPRRGVAEKSKIESISRSASLRLCARKQDLNKYQHGQKRDIICRSDKCEERGDAAICRFMQSVEAQKDKGYGKQVVERLAADLHTEFP